MANTSDVKNVVLTCPHCRYDFLFQPWRPETGLYCRQRCQDHAYERYEQEHIHPLDICEECRNPQRR